MAFEAYTESQVFDNLSEELKIWPERTTPILFKMVSGVYQKCIQDLKIPKNLGMQKYKNAPNKGGEIAVPGLESCSCADTKNQQIIKTHFTLFTTYAY